MNADTPRVNRRTVTRILLRAALLQAVVYAAIAFFGPCRPAPAVEGLAANRRHVLEWLPSRRREVIEQVLAGWQQRALPTQDTVFGSRFAREYPGSFAVEYRQGERAIIWVMYSATGASVATRYSDQ